MAPCCYGMRRTLESRTIHAGNAWSEHLAFADNGRLLAVSTGRTLRVFDAGGALRAVFESHPGVIAALAWRPKSVEVAVAGNGGMRIHGSSRSSRRATTRCAAPA